MFFFNHAGREIEKLEVSKPQTRNRERVRGGAGARGGMGRDRLVPVSPDLSPSKYNTSNLLVHAGEWHV
jgi:hypothetical protein